MRPCSTRLYSTLDACQDAASRESRSSRRPRTIGGSVACRGDRPRQHAEDRPQPGAECPAGRPAATTAGRGAAVGAHQPMEPYSSTVGSIGGTLATWCLSGPGIVAGEIMATAAAGRRLAVDGLPESFGRDQRPGVMAMAGLPPRFRPEAGAGGRRLTGAGRTRGAWRNWWSPCRAAPPTRRSAARRIRPGPHLAVECRVRVADHRLSRRRAPPAR